MFKISFEKGKLFPSECWTVWVHRGPDYKQWNAEWCPGSRPIFAFSKPSSILIALLLVTKPKSSIWMQQGPQSLKMKPNVVQTVGQPGHLGSWPQWTKPWQRRLQSKEVCHHLCSTTIILPFKIALHIFFSGRRVVQRQSLVRRRPSCPSTTCAPLRSPS